MKTNIGRTIVSGAYGAGEVVGETEHTLELRLLGSQTRVTVNKAGNLHYIDGHRESDMGDHATPCPECSAIGQHYAICSQSE